MNLSLYLSQSYQDAWSDYQRSLHSPNFPTWDYIILTASNERQARSFRLQLEARKQFIPAHVKVVVIPDEGGVRIGSGGATLSVLKYLRERENSFSNLRILVIHSGGDSKRVPQYSALGKLFSPVPHRLPDGRSSTLFDEFLITMSAVPGRIREGMLLLSGDVLLLFNPLLIDWSGKGAAVISFKESVETGKNHGVYLCGDDGYVRRFLHKQSVETIRSLGAINDHNDVDIDTGAVLFGVDVLEALWTMISTEDRIDLKKYTAFVSDKICLSLYGDFQYPLAADSTLEGFYQENAEGVHGEELLACRTALWHTLCHFRMKLLRLAPAKFIHFGTTKEILHLMNSNVEDYDKLDWSNRVNCSIESGAGYNAVADPGTSIADTAYLEVSYVHGASRVGDGSVLSFIDICHQTIPPHVVLHGLKQLDGSFVCRIYGTEDNPKENKLFGKELTGDLWDGGVPHALWFAKIYPEKKTVDEAVAAALEIYNIVTHGGMLKGGGKSMAEGFNDADPEAIIDWNNRMIELVTMNHMQEMIDSRMPALQVDTFHSLTKLQQEWLDFRVKKASLMERIRLHYYVGTALNDEGEVGKAFATLTESILQSTLTGLKENADARITKDQHKVELPLRVNWGGGWSDTPPYCNENGGTVLNAAILLNGRRPVQVLLKRLEEYKVVFESTDMDVYGEFDRIEELQSVGDPFDPFVLQKAALLACGVIPSSGGDLKAVLTRLGGGIWMDTKAVGVPKGSGLGTSSILAAGCVKALFDFLSIPYDENKLYSTVLCMEQIMSTGGGWQDQVGGLTDGIKYTTSKPGIRQIIKVQYVKPEAETLTELRSRFCIIYTGQRRLARNLLRDVVGRYIGNEPDTVYALNEIQKNATLQRFELERGNVEAFAELLDEHWKLSKMIDEGSTNTLIDQIFDSVDDLLAGRMICGAGGGGFLQVMLKRGVCKEQLQARLKEVFADTEIGVWDCELV